MNSFLCLKEDIMASRQYTIRNFNVLLLAARVQCSRYSSMLAATLLCAIMVPLSVAYADDYAIGPDARAFAMGGAGLALSRNLDPNAQRYNPAALGFTPHGIDFYTPSLGLRVSGAATISKLSKAAKKGSGTDSYTYLLREFVESDSIVGAHAGLGFRIGPLEITSGATVSGKILPNAALSNWANVRTKGDAPANAAADLVGVGYFTLPSVAFGFKIPSGSKAMNTGYDIAIGARVKVIRTYYTRYIANSDVFQTDSSSTAIAAPELNEGNNLSKRGGAADLGVLLRPRKDKGVNFGFVAENLVNRGTTFTATNSVHYQGRIANGQRFQPLQATLSAGTAYEAKGVILAADLADITSATGSIEFRVGGEEKLGVLSLRAGYSSSTGFTAGVGIFGIDAATGSRLPLEIIKTIKF